MKLMAYHFDFKRGLWSRDYMDRMVDHLKRWGYNTILVELENKLQFHKHPAVSTPDAMSHEEMRNFVSTCREKQVDVIPLVQTLGHAWYVLTKPEYSHLREMPDVLDQYDPLSKEAHRLVIDLIDETIDAIAPHDFFHVGGDETWSLGRSERARKIVEKIGTGGLYLRHMMPVFEHLHQRGLRPVIWADMCLTHPDIVSRIPGYVVMVDWDYVTTSERPSEIMVWGELESGVRNPCLDWKSYQRDVPEGTFRVFLEEYAVDDRTPEDGTFRGFYGTDALKGMGRRDVPVASANSSCGDLAGVPESSRHVPNCFFAARKGMGDGSGLLVTSWAVRHVHSELKHLATFAGARGMEGGEYDFDSLCREFTRDFYGIELSEFSRAVLLAERSFETGQAHVLLDLKSSLEKGKNGLPAILRSMSERFGGDREAVKHLEELRDGFREARHLLESMSDRAVTNRENFEFWFEGVDLSIFYADFTIAALENTVREHVNVLSGRLEALKTNTARVFAPTFTEHGLKLELKMRYGFHESCFGFCSGGLQTHLLQV